MNNNKKISTKQILIILTTFVIAVILIFGLLSFVANKTNEESVDKETAIKNSKLLIENAVNLHKDGDLTQLYFKRDDIQNEIRLKSCLKSSDIISKNFIGLKSCYTLNNVNNIPTYANGLIFVTPKKVKMIHYEKLNKNEQKVTFALDILATRTQLKSTDSSSDGSTITYEGKLHFDYIYCITDEHGLVVKTNIQDELKDLSYLYDGGDIKGVTWTEKK